MLAPTCPIPEVDTVLSPFINSSQATLKIRRALTRYLAANAASTGTQMQYQHLNYECPQSHSRSVRKAQELKNIRLKYLHALERQTEIQERYRKLRESLKAQRDENVLDTQTQNDSKYDNEVTRSYVALLRHRRHFSELQVIQETIEKLMDTNPTSTRKDPKTLVKDIIGEQPELPAERLDLLSQPLEADSLLFRLQREVIEAKANMDQTEIAALDVTNKNASICPSLEERVYALGCARDEMIAWIEGELSKMNEESEILEDPSPVKKWSGAGLQMDVASSETQIRDSYRRYLTSRSGLTKILDTIQRASSTSNPSTTNPSNVPRPISPTNASGSLEITLSALSHLPPLIQTIRNERSLLQEVVYLQAQISAADEEIVDTLSRLSEESHLLGSGSEELTAWSKTAKQVETNTGNVIINELKEIRQELDGIQAIVDLCSLQSTMLVSTKRSEGNSS
ncbi:hypothetical protein CC78DRAFT_130794 [Lojkania enalia]|uniref:Uncharacterized protein n=1 Tax=Lojkania enalia TaxID=147567 RepID=A0A9P4NC73_9PLEO|nr:hypothetical protein CC78DRAFT_130794 [Didymosphaeria enalia]